MPSPFQAVRCTGSAEGRGCSLKAGRIKTATHAGTAQTLAYRHNTISGGSGFDWRAQLRHSIGLPGPACETARNLLMYEFAFHLLIASRNARSVSGDGLNEPGRLP